MPPGNPAGYNVGDRSPNVRQVPGWFDPSGYIGRGGGFGTTYTDKGPRDKDLGEGDRPGTGPEKGGFWSIYKYDENGNRTINWGMVSWYAGLLYTIGSAAGGAAGGSGGGGGGGGEGAPADNSGGSGAEWFQQNGMDLFKSILNNAQTTNNVLTGGGGNNQQAAMLAQQRYNQRRQQPPSQQPPARPMFVPQTISPLNVLPANQQSMA